MATDDERRLVAERLRSLRNVGGGVTSINHGYLWSLLWAASGEELSGSYPNDWFERFCARLADLIEPVCDASATHTDASATREVSQSRRSDVDREARGWTSFDERLPEPGSPVLCRGRNGAFYVGKPVTFGGERTAKVWVPRGNEYRSPAAWRPIEPPSCDRGALLDLIGDMDADLEALGQDRSLRYASTALIANYARRIREACGLVEGS